MNGLTCSVPYSDSRDPYRGMALLPAPSLTTGAVDFGSQSGPLGPSWPNPTSSEAPCWDMDYTLALLLVSRHPPEVQLHLPPTCLPSANSAIAKHMHAHTLHSSYFSRLSTQNQVAIRKGPEAGNQKALILSSPSILP